MPIDLQLRTPHHVSRTTYPYVCRERYIRMHIDLQLHAPHDLSRTIYPYAYRLAASNRSPAAARARDDL